MSLLIPDWPAPANVRALSTTREGGFSSGAYSGLNLGAHVGDSKLSVWSNRKFLASLARLPVAPVWLEQVHSADVVELPASAQRSADAAWSRKPNTVCTVMTADCLPVLLCSTQGDCVAAVHAGWRGLAGGVIANTVTELPAAPGHLMAWLGPAIGPKAFEVGGEVREQFLQYLPGCDACFVAHGDKYLADVYQLARLELQRLGVTNIYGGDQCTYSDAERYFSYRRACHEDDGRTGRMASLIWFE